MLAAIILIISGILAVPSLILAKKPDAKPLLDKISLYQGWFGVAILFWGIWGIISFLLNVVTFIGSGSIATWILSILMIVIAIVETGLGFILGFNLINQYILSKNEESQKKGEQLLAKILPFQGILSISAIVIGIVAIVLLLVL